MPEKLTAWSVLPHGQEGRVGPLSLMLNPRLLLPAIVLASSLASPALACTTAEVRSKAAAVLAKMQELAPKDPEKAAEIERMLSRIQTKSITDPDRDCKLFDNILAKFE